MSGKGTTPKNLKDISQLLQTGGEPKDLLLALLWSPLETLLARGDARLFVGQGTIAIFLHGVDLVPHLGLVLADKEKVLANENKDTTP
jgi:hypothetical protein